MKKHEKLLLLRPVESTNDITFCHVFFIIAALMGTIFQGLIPHSFGTVIANFRTNNTRDITRFQITQFELNWIPATSSVISCILLPIFVMVVQNLNRYYQLISTGSFIILGASCGLSSVMHKWPLFFFSYTIIYSIGCTLFCALVIVVSDEYFPSGHKFHTFTICICQIGFPIASVIGNPVLAKLFIEYGWETSFQFVAAVELIGGIFISCFIQSINWRGFYDCLMELIEEETNTDCLCDTNDKESVSESLLNYFASNLQIWPWLIGKFINYTCWYGLRTNIVTYLVTSTTFGLTKSAALMSMFSAAEIVIAITVSMFGDIFQGYLIHIHIASSVILALFTGIYTSALSTYLSATLLMIGIGMFVQLSMCFSYPASVEVWNSEFDMKTCWVLTNVAAGLGIITSPLFSGILMDLFGFGTLFYSQCCGWTLQALLFSLTLLIIKVKEIPSDQYQELP